MKRVLLGTIALGCLALPQSARADPPATPAKWWRNGEKILQRYEFYQMLSAVASGSRMGPGDGWFHPSQSRYDWKWLAARCGTANGSVTPREFLGPLSLFHRLDRDGNGVVTPDDFDWTDKAPFLKQVGMARQWFGRLDRDSNGRVSRSEWDAFFEQAAKGKDHLTVDDLRLALFGTAPPPVAKGKKDAGPSPELLLERLLTGELGSPFEGPRVGHRAPDFALPAPDGKQTYRLSQFLGKPVVLVFGSFT
jgi:hypothetical protein